MARFGFIHDKLDVKLLVLYLMARVAAPVDLQTLTGLVMCDEGVDYFQFSEVLLELVQTEHLILEDDCYAITEKGQRNGSACESSLPYVVRVKCDHNLAKLNSLLRRNAEVRADVLSRDDGAFTLRLSLDDAQGNLLTVELLSATAQQATAIGERFRAHPEEIYNGILAVLLKERKEE